MRAPSRIAIAVAVTLACAAWPRAAFAEPPADRARAAELKRRGDEAIEALRYADALQAYEAAFAISGEPALLYNMGRAHEALGNFPDALANLEAFQSQAPADLRAKVPLLGERIADLKKRVGKLMVRSRVEGGRVILGSKVIGALPFRAPVPVNAGKALLEVSAEGHRPFSKEVVIPGGGELEVEVDLLAKAELGTLAITSSVVGAEISVDDKPAGTTPIELTVPPGAHDVRAAKAGYRTVRTSFVVGAGERKSVSIPLEAEPGVTSRWWFWTGIGAVVVAGVVTTYALLTERPADEGTYPPGRVAGPLVVGRAFSF